MFERSYTTETPWNAGSHLGRRSDGFEGAGADGSHGAVEVEQLKAQVQLGLAERERAELQQQHQALIDRQMAQEELQARPVCLKRKLWCFCNAD